MTDSNSDAANVRWLSYDEIADMRGIDRASAIRMVRRKRWPKQDGNDGTTRVAVPGQFFRTKRTKQDDLGQTPTLPVLFIPGQALNDPGQPADKSSATKALEDAVATLVEELGQDRAELRAEVAVLQLRVEMAEADTKAERELRTEAEKRAAVAEAKLEAAEAALTEARRPFWRRWIG
ncbi:hypothetical protein JMJ56_29315 [Belnapia sp. T18]|uniref:Uncharacterized protein n=1 Tax=Belnapia arida TaxID=2804533 RepID=A0ABS1UC22_9PROT|nr:hypothetical protein [Belnapia arida]MBL6082080.1 hypothetical protein [Belnapia arida]